MKIIIYGGGCKACHALYENAQSAAKSKGIIAEFEYITDMKVIMQKGFMTMPVLEIDGKVVSKGKVLKDKEIEKLL